ncbi:MAG: 2-hydroxyacyl-CoA dehydratase, partial [Candidatus Thorarchaeota archaeon]
TKGSDPIENYAQFLLDASNKGIGCDTENLASSYLNAAKKMEVDGLIFNQVFGCPSMSNIYEKLRRKVESELKMPSIVIKFKKIGDNIEEIEKQLRPFMEELKRS